ncbi:hypothetical protein ABIC28_005134 [Rhodococcus sp. PvR044]|uniref:hypothetical protein n=1 Tax=Rhodococcus sp. PvR044 TaxID=3156402 RepID=UPI0033940329
MSTRNATTPPPRILVSRITDQHKKVSRNADSVRERLKNGAKLVIVDTGDQTIELLDKDLVGAGQDWTLRISGTSTVRIHLSTPLPKGAQIVATGGSFVEVTGQGTLYAYTRSRVHAFGEWTVHARNFADISVCDSCTAVSMDDTTVTAYDTAHVDASGRSRVTGTDQSSMHLSEDAHGSVTRGVKVTGPSRSNLYATRPTG